MLSTARRPRASAQVRPRAMGTRKRPPPQHTAHSAQRYYYVDALHTAVIGMACCVLACSACAWSALFPGRALIALAASWKAPHSETKGPYETGHICIELMICTLYLYTLPKPLSTTSARPPTRPRHDSISRGSARRLWVCVWASRPSRPNSAQRTALRFFYKL